MKRTVIRSLLILGSCLAPLVLFELGSRFFVEPSDVSWGRLMGSELPPLRVVVDTVKPKVDPAQVWRDRRRPNPEGLTLGDLWGVAREDRVMGHTFQENARSVRDWWQSNNIGARSRTDTAAVVPAGKRRVLVLGESFAHGSRVKQEEAWPTVLGSLEPVLDVVNLGVDGYGMGQAFLRFQEITKTHAYDVALFMFVPECDLWRDINTMRNLGEGWASYTIFPRYEITGGALTLVPGPYEIGTDIYQRDVPVLTDRVREHLRRHDRFYEPLLYEPMPFFDHLVSFKLIARRIGERRRDRTYDRANFTADSEAMEVTRGIFLEARRRALAAGRKFLLVVLPDPPLVKAVQDDASSPRLATWNARIAQLRADGLEMLDLMPAMKAAPPDRIDLGYDGSHYGPQGNRLIAEQVAGALR